MYLTRSFACEVAVQAGGHRHNPSKLVPMRCNLQPKASKSGCNACDAHVPDEVVRPHGAVQAGGHPHACPLQAGAYALDVGASAFLKLAKAGFNIHDARSPDEVVRPHGAVQAGGHQHVAAGQEGHRADGRLVVREGDEAEAAGLLEQLDLGWEREARASRVC